MILHLLHWWQRCTVMYFTVLCFFSVFGKLLENCRLKEMILYLSRASKLRTSPLCGKTLVNNVLCTRFLPGSTMQIVLCRAPEFRKSKALSTHHVPILTFYVVLGHSGDRQADWQVIIQVILHEHNNYPLDLFEALIHNITKNTLDLCYDKYTHVLLPDSKVISSGITLDSFTTWII